MVIATAMTVAVEVAGGIFDIKKRKVRSYGLMQYRYLFLTFS